MCGVGRYATEVMRSADLVDYTAEEGLRVLNQGKLLHSDSFPGAERNKLCMVSKVPLGVVLCIPPFNYPVNLAVSKIAPALIAGRGHCDTNAQNQRAWGC